jgi:hypothetical protein
MSRRSPFDIRLSNEDRSVELLGKFADLGVHGGDHGHSGRARVLSRHEGWGQVTSSLKSSAYVRWMREPSAFRPA